MNKEDIHAKLRSSADKIKISVDDFISAYGDDEPRKVDETLKYRADILATAYGKKVTKVNNDYIFTKH